VVTSHAPPIIVPLRYMLLGLVCFALFAVDLAVQARSYAVLDPGMPAIVGLTHVLTLGALLSFVMGAVYQLSTVAFLMPLASERAARLNFWLYLVALVGLIPSMMAWWRTGLLGFGALMAAAVYVYAVVMLVSLHRTSVRGPMRGFVVSAHVYLLLAITVAVLLVLTDGGALPALGPWLGPLIPSHILLVAGGYFLFLILGFSCKLLPMFTLSHGFATGGQAWTLRLAHAALWLLIAAAWLPWRGLWWFGFAAAAATVVSQLWNLRAIIKKRMRRRIEAPIQGVLIAAVIGAVWVVLLAVQLAWMHGQPGWRTLVQFELLGVVALTVMGFAYKIVPFLIWTQRYSKPKPDGKRVLIADLIRVGQAQPVLGTFVVGVWVLAGASLAESVVAAWIGAVFTAVAVFVFCVQMLRVVEPIRAGKELFHRD
jgi:hypothetical protein